MIVLSNNQIEQGRQPVSQLGSQAARQALARQVWECSKAVLSSQFVESTGWTGLVTGGPAGLLV